jgi:UDP-2,3-diacylglucosamine pyrophosphatase LpxH
MKAIILSDLHIGSRYFLRHDFEQFLSNIPEDVDLILNGDIINNPYEKMDSADRQILDRFGDMSLRQRVVWVRGNHDNGYVPDNLGNIQVKKHHTLQKRLFVTHGDFFDEVMPRSQMFIKAFKMMHDLRVKLGARPVHVAQYAKHWKRFYAYLRKNVMLNAVNYAVKNDFKAVACGHTHFVEEHFVNGIKYLNTGAWTEQPTYYVRVTDNEITLKKTADTAWLKSHETDTIHVSSDHHQSFPQTVSHHN